MKTHLIKKKYTPKTYPPLEEKINVISHGIGCLLSVLALILLLIKATHQGDTWHIVSFAIYGISLVLLYLASTLFHNSKERNSRHKLNVFDHASIFVLIAGTYTPYTLITLRESYGWWIFGIIWGLAITGIVLKLFFTGRHKLLSTIMYVLMGWIAMFVSKTLMNNLSKDGFQWLIFGGIAYTLGAILYSISKIKFNHAIFHSFVLAGSFCHFISIYYYII